MKKLSPKQFLKKHQELLSYADPSDNNIFVLSLENLEMLLEGYARLKIKELDARLVPDTRIFPPFV